MARGMGKPLPRTTTDAGGAPNAGRIEKRPRSPVVAPSPTSSSASPPVPDIIIANSTEPDSSIEENRHLGTNGAGHTVILAPGLIENSINPNLSSVSQVASEPGSDINASNANATVDFQSLRREADSEIGLPRSRDRNTSLSVNRRSRSRQIRVAQRLCQRWREIEDRLEVLLEGLETEQELLLHVMSQNDEQQED